MCTAIQRMLTPGTVPIITCGSAVAEASPAGHVGRQREAQAGRQDAGRQDLGNASRLDPAVRTPPPPHRGGVLAVPGPAGASGGCSSAKRTEPPPVQLAAITRLCASVGGGGQGAGAEASSAKRCHGVEEGRGVLVWSMAAASSDGCGQGVRMRWDCGQGEPGGPGVRGSLRACVTSGEQWAAREAPLKGWARLGQTRGVLSQCSSAWGLRTGPNPDTLRVSRGEIH